MKLPVDCAAPESKVPSGVGAVPEVTVWITAPPQFQVIVPLTLIDTVAGSNLLSSTITDSAVGVARSGAAVARSGAGAAIARSGVLDEPEPQPPSANAIASQAIRILVSYPESSEPAASSSSRTAARAFSVRPWSSGP